jgi:ABC-2 type transport system permease protein
VNGPVAELLARSIQAVRRSSIWWAVAIVAFAVLNAAFWPSLEGSEALEGFEEMGDLLEAFGAQNLTSAAGYLDGQVFALLLPLLLSGMAVAQVSLLTAGDEAAGRLELLHALPVSRRTIWITRWAACLTTLLVVSVVVAVAVAICLPVFSFTGVSVASVVAATAACGLLAAFHASIAYAASGAGASRGLAVGAAIGVLLVGYLLSYVLPIADSLDGARAWSPWYWALGEQPVLDGVSVGRLAVLALLTAGIVLVGTVAVDRRDIHSA